MSPVEAGLRFRKITVLIFVILIMAGVSGFLTVPRYEDPQFKVFIARVHTFYPGATAEQVEALVTRPLEEKIDELKDIKTVFSSSSSGVSTIYVELTDHADREKTWDDLRRKVNEVRGLLPPGVSEPLVEDELNRTSSLILHLNAPPGEKVTVLREIAENWRDVIKQVPGVEKVEVTGLPAEEVQLILDPGALAARQLSWTHLADAIQKRNVQVPGGVVREGQVALLVESSGEYVTLAEIEETIIYQRPGGAAVKVKDVAEVRLSAARTETLVETNGHPGVALTIFAREGYSVFAFEQDVMRLVGELRPDLPPRIEAVTVFNQSESIQSKFKDLWRELLLGMGAVVLVCMLGLHWRTALIVALAIPVSAAVGFGVLVALGVTMHQITIASLILALGILVDDAIVVNDNIERHLAQGSDRYTAALSGSTEVALPITTATVATVAGFFPLMLLQGNIGEFIRTLPQVVTVTMLASLAVSLWLVPAIRLWAARPSVRVKSSRTSFYHTGLLGFALERLSNWYGARLAVTLRRPWLTVISALCLSAGALVMLPFMGVQFFPYAERNEFVIDVYTTRGSSLHETAAAAREVAATVSARSGVKEVFTYIGQQAPKFYYNEITGDRGEDVAQLLVVAEDRGWQATHDLIKILQDDLAGTIPGARVMVREMEQGPPIGAPVAIRVKGDNIAQLRSLADQIADILRRTPGAMNVYDNMGPDTYTARVNSVPDLTSRWGVAERDIAHSVRLAVRGLEVSVYRDGDKLYPVVLRTSSPDGTGLAGLEELWLPSWKTGSIIPLSQVASVDVGWDTGTINRRDLERSVTVRAYPTGSTLPSSIIREASREINAIPLPPGYSIDYGGENEERNAAFASIGKLSMVVILLIYLIIAMQFYSLTKPLIILLSVYLAIAGAVLGLFLTSTPVGFMALLGIVSLSGIVVRNGIVLIDFIEHGLRHGKSLGEAIEQAGKVRLRPILLTSFTAVGALLPMAIMGGSLWRPMAVSIISGLLFSTVLTLIVVPNAYLLLTKLRR